MPTGDPPNRNYGPGGSFAGTGGYGGSFASRDPYTQALYNQNYQNPYLNMGLQGLQGMGAPNFGGMNPMSQQMMDAQQQANMDQLARQYSQLYNEQSYLQALQSPVPNRMIPVPKAAKVEPGDGKVHLDLEEHKEIEMPIIKGREIEI